jgi:small-conductance mechanosensitive channel
LHHINHLNRVHGQLALEVATTFLAVLVASIFIAEVMYLPFRILVLQGIPLLLAVVVTAYLWLHSMKTYDFEKGKTRWLSPRLW